MKNYIYFILICLYTGLTSCQSDDENDTSMRAYTPEIFTSDFLKLESVNRWILTDKTTIPVGHVGLLKIEGGNGQYMAQSANDEIAEILCHPADSKVFTIGSKGELGTTTVTIMDEENNMLTIPVIVSEYKKTYMFCQSYPKMVIMVGEKELEEPLKHIIEEKINERYIFKGYETLGLIYENASSGKLVIGDRLGKENLFGIFKETKEGKYNYVDMTVDGKEYHFMVTNNQSILLREVGPETIHFIEDLTELFRIDYPKITKALVITTMCL